MEDELVEDLPCPAFLPPPSVETTAPSAGMATMLVPMAEQISTKDPDACAVSNREDHGPTDDRSDGNNAASRIVNDTIQVRR